MASTHKTHTLSSGKEVHIFDGLLPLQLRSHIFAFLTASRFILGWEDGNDETAAKHAYLHSVFSEDDTIRAGLFQYLAQTKIANLIADKRLVKSIVNLSVPSDTHFAHAHAEKLVVLYYPNPRWEQHWHGETLFYTEDLSEIELAIRYTPGRIVVFDGSIPHSMRPQSTSADSYRFTYAMTFD